MHRLYTESKEEPTRSKDEGTHREIKELHYRSNYKEELMEELMDEPLQSKGSKCRNLNFLSWKNRVRTEEGLNGCIAGSLSESL